MTEKVSEQDLKKLVIEHFKNRVINGAISDAVDKLFTGGSWSLTFTPNTVEVATSDSSKSTVSLIEKKAS